MLEARALPPETARPGVLLGVRVLCIHGLAATALLVEECRFSHAPLPPNAFFCPMVVHGLNKLGYLGWTNQTALRRTVCTVCWCLASFKRPRMPCRSNTIIVIRLLLWIPSVGYCICFFPKTNFIDTTTVRHYYCNTAVRRP